MVARAPAPRPTANGRSTWQCCGAPVRDFTYHKCAGRPAANPRSTAPAKAPRPRAGAVHEIALRTALVNAGFIDVLTLEPGRTVETDRLFVVELTWLPGERLYRFDVGLPALKVAVDVDGGAHAAGKAKLRADTERRGLAAAHGWRVVAVTPEQVRDGTAVELVKAALAAREV